MNKDVLNNVSDGSGSDSEGPIDIAHQPSASSSSSSSSGGSGSNKSSSGSSSGSGGISESSSSSSSSSASNGGGNSSSGSGSEPMGPVRIVSTTESPSATSGGSGSGGGSSSDGGTDELSKSIALTPYNKTNGKQTDNELPKGPVLNVEGWRAHLEIRRARGKLTEREKKARERAILALSLNFPSALSSSSSSSSPSSPSLFAVISLAGKQFKVSPGDIVIADRLKNFAVSSELSLSPHIVGSPIRTLVGRPVVQGASVICVVESHELDEKVIVFKKKRRKRYQRTQGHRREISRIRIDKIICDVETY